MYFTFIVIYVGPRPSFHYVWMASGAVFLCVGKSLETGSWFLIPEILRKLLILCAGLGLVLFLFMEILVFSKMGAVPKRPVRYVIVLGACVRGTRVTRSLAFRLKKAAEYADAHPDCMLVVSGGQGPGEDITEAQAMRDWLVSHGIAAERILQEDRSVNTRENLLFSKEVICRHEAAVKGKTELSVAVCSNNFHMYRALALAKAVGTWQTEGLAAMTDPFMWLSFTVREGIALFKELIFGHIRI